MSLFKKVSIMLTVGIIIMFMFDFFNGQPASWLAVFFGWGILLVEDIYNIFN